MRSTGETQVERCAVTVAKALIEVGMKQFGRTVPITMSIITYPDSLLFPALMREIRAAKSSIQVMTSYRLLDAEENLYLHRYVGGHKFHGKKSIPWLVNELCKQ